MQISVKKFCKRVASQNHQDKARFEKRLTSLNKKLNCINLKADNAIKIIEATNVKIDQVKCALRQITRVEAEGALLRSKLRWIEHGEKSSKYFLNLEKFRSKAKTMSVCELQDGSLTRNHTLILQEQVNFYENLYTKDNSVKFQYQNSKQSMLNDTQQILLGSEINVKELGEALKEMSNNKTPGIDGIPADFYKIFWSRLQDLFYKAIMYGKAQGKMFGSA